ncbi:MAG: putative Zn finger-like uncharacterized protein [Oceanicoccus sp.]|jgi:predicted Zn finger-like uncharacterized protein
MNQTQITKCPKCDTTFRVSPAQLQVAKGAVRCGACLHVFRATDHIQANKKPESVIQDDRTEDMFGEKAEPSKPATKPQPAIQEAPTTDDEFDFLIDDNNGLIDDDYDIDDNTYNDKNLINETGFDDDSGLIDDNNGIDDDDDALIDDNYGRKTPIINDLNEDFLSLNTQDHADPFFTESDKNDKVESTNLSNDESWAESLLNDSDDADVKEEQKKHLKPVSNAPAFSYIEADPLDLSLPNKANRRQFWLIASACSLLILTFCAQLAYFNFDQWARMDQYRGYYALACEQLNCRLPSSYDVSQIRTTASPQVSSHPKFNNALTVDVLFMNNAAYEQAFPKLELTFTDKNDKVIAHRLFLPREYLAGEASGLSVMPIDTPIHIALEIKDPGPKANNYQVRFVAP